MLLNDVFVQQPTYYSGHGCLAGAGVTNKAHMHTGAVRHFILTVEQDLIGDFLYLFFDLFHPLHAVECLLSRRFAILRRQYCRQGITCYGT